MMTPAIKKRLEKFLKNISLQEKFLRAVLEADVSEILWPEMNPGRFGRPFVSKVEGRSCAYPLLMENIKIQTLEYRIRSLQNDAGAIINPSIAYYHIRKYEFELLKKKIPKKKKPVETLAKRRTPGISKTSKKSSGKKNNPYFIDESMNASDILERIQKIKKKISVSPAVRKARDEKSLLVAVLGEQRRLTTDFAELSKKYDAALVQLSLYKNPDFMHKEHRTRMEELEMLLEEYASRVRHESSRADLLEREVTRLTEQIITMPYGAGRDELEELEAIRKEHSILSQKYDTLVSKNIDLANRLERENSTKSLETLLDTVRDKINATLKSSATGTKEGDMAILHRLKSEITQLKRARMYLGKALYDMGILYLRTGEKASAVEELRAAKELGIEDPETNKIINSH